MVERTAELEASRAEAEAANLGKTRFIAAASHDLLQPLHAARLFTAALTLQSSALASDFASAYRSGSRFTVSLMVSLWCSGAVMSTDSAMG